MARQLRHFVPHIPVHVIQRGNNRQPCFFNSRDRVVYLGKLREYSRDYDIAVHSFVLMTNHVHLLLTPQQPESVSLLLQALGAYYVRYVNSTQQRTGTLWEGRFRASLVDSDRYFLAVSRYIELNPVRAGMVDNPGDYPWSSYRMNALGKPFKLLTPHPAYLTLGITETSRQQRYRQLFANSLSKNEIDTIRTTVNRSWALGSDHFKHTMEQQLGHALPPFRRGGNRTKGVGDVCSKLEQTSPTPLVLA